LEQNPETSGANQKQPVFWKKKMKARQVTSIIVLLFCLVISSTTCLFHDDDCLFGALNKGKKDVPSSSEHCLACMFSAGFNSTEADHELPLLDVENPVICQPEWHFTFVDHHEWSYSILLRAPPLISTS
jgi:hypothetical protein